MSTKETERRRVDPVPVTPGAGALKDSPAVERALGRSKMYLLISWSLLYPEDDEFLDYLQSGEFVEDGRSALEGLSAALAGQGGEKAKLKVAALLKHLDTIEQWVATECTHWTL